MSLEFLLTGVCSGCLLGGDSFVRMLVLSLHEFFIVACNFVRFHTFIIVSKYIDISHKMNYNRNLQFGRLEI